MGKIKLTRKNCTAAFADKSWAASLQKWKCSSTAQYRDQLRQRRGRTRPEREHERETARVHFHVQFVITDPRKMQVLQFLSVFVFGLLVSAQQSPPKELEIKTTYSPQDCTVKAKKGDRIQVHYVRSCAVGLGFRTPASLRCGTLRRG